MSQSFALQFTSPNYPFVGFLLLKCRLDPHSSSGPYILDLAIFADLVYVWFARFALMSGHKKHFSSFFIIIFAFSRKD